MPERLVTLLVMIGNENLQIAALSVLQLRYRCTCTVPVKGRPCWLVAWQQASKGFPRVCFREACHDVVVPVHSLTKGLAITPALVLRGAES